MTPLKEVLLIPCIMIGDSIAVGVGQARPECETVARVGISSSRYVSTLLPPGRTSAGTAVISLGVNDGDTTDTLDNLREVRSRIDAATVVWLLPGLKEAVRDMIRTVAAENNDRTLDTRPQVGRDHLHPTGRGYETIAAAIIGPEAGAAPNVEVAYAPDEAQQPLSRSANLIQRGHRLHGARQAKGRHTVTHHVAHGPARHPAHVATRGTGAHAAATAHRPATKPGTRLATSCTSPRGCRAPQSRS
jgi:hypothetical protein